MYPRRCFTLIFLALSTSAFGVPHVMSHQGRIAVDGVNVDGAAQFKFALVGGGDTFWTNDGTLSGEPASSVPVTVSKGHYAVLLGAAPMVELSPTIFSAEDDVSLRVWFSNDGATFDQLIPDRRITPAGYAFAAKTLAPSYSSGQTLELDSVAAGGALQFGASFGQSFASAPEVVLGGDWSLISSDGEGFTATANFVTETVDAVGFKGSHASLAFIAGRPAIAYRDEGDSDLLFARGGSEWSIVRVAGAGVGDAGDYASLAEVVGRPAIAYYDAGTGDLKFVRANNVEGTSWPSALTVDGASGNIGRYVSLAMIAGKPAISYTSPNTGELKFAEALDAEGTTWQTSVVEGVISDYREYTSLADLNGQPAIAVRDATRGVLRCVVRDITGGWNGVDVDGADGREPSLAVVGGHLAIAYESAAGALRFVRATTPAGDAFGTALTIAPAGAQPSLAEIAGRPAISFHDTAGGDLAIALEATDSSWTTTIIDGAAGNVGAFSSLVEHGGLPAIAYRDSFSADLKFATLPRATWSASLGGPTPILAAGVKNGAVTETMLSPELSERLDAKDAEIAELIARVAALEAAVFGGTN